MTKNFRLINDPDFVARLKFVSDQLEPRATTETRSEREAKAQRREARQRALRHARLVKRHQTKLTLAALATLDWLDKKK